MCSGRSASSRRRPRPSSRRRSNRRWAEGSTFDVELPLTTARGTPRWVRAVGVPEVEHGRCVRLTGIFQDLTGQREMQAQRHRADARLASVIASLDDLVFVMDAEGRITDFHQSAERKDLVMPPVAFLGRIAVEVLPSAISVPLAEALDSLRRGAPAVQFDYLVETPGGERCFNCRVAGFAGLDGRLLGMTAVARDVTESMQDAGRCA